MATINKLHYDAREFDVLKNNGYFIVMHKSSGMIDRFKVRAGNHNEKMVLTFYNRNKYLCIHLFLCYF